MAAFCYIYGMLDIDTIKTMYHGNRDIDTETFLEQYATLSSTENREMTGESLVVRYTVQQYVFRDGYKFYRITNQGGISQFDFFLDTNSPIMVTYEIYNLAFRDLPSASQNNGTDEQNQGPTDFKFSSSENLIVALLLLFILALFISLR